MKSNWQWKPLGEVLKTGAGGTPLKAKKEYYEGGSIPWLMSGEVSQGDVWTANNFITKKGLENSSAKMFPEGTVLVAMYGATAGQVGILRFAAATNQAVCGILPSESFVTKFLYYVLISRKTELIAQAIGNAQPNISQEKIRNTAIPVLPIAEQKRIVAILDQAFEAIDTARENAEKNLQNGNEVFDSYLNSLFENTDSHWEETSLDHLCEIKHGFAFDGADFSNKVPEGHPIVVTPGNFSETGTLIFNEQNTKRFKGKPPKHWLFDLGDLVVVMTDLSSKMKILGKPAFVEQDNLLHNQRIGRVVFKNDRVLPQIVYYFMMSKRFLTNIRRSATGTMVRHTAPTRILANTIRYPVDRKEQAAVVKRLDALRDQTLCLRNKYKQKSAKLSDLRSSVLNQAFVGGLR